VTEPELGRVVAVISDVHGAAGTLERALAECRREGAETVALLGDLVDRTEQADACAAALAGWPVVGVYGNHEREIALEAEDHGGLAPETVALLSSLREHLTVGDVCFAHEMAHWGLHHGPLARLLEVVHHDPCAAARITFVGHSHVRAARDEHGALDINRGSLTLSPRRRYLINPGALTAGQFALWDRAAQVVTFHHVER
jgi:predicted phosphodiesterase